MSVSQEKMRLRELARKTVHDYADSLWEDDMSEYEHSKKVDAEIQRIYHQMLRDQNIADVDAPTMLPRSNAPIERARAAKTSKMLDKRVTVGGRTMTRKEFLLDIAAQGGQLQPDGSVRTSSTIWPLNATEREFFKTIVRRSR